MAKSLFFLCVCVIVSSEMGGRLKAGIFEETKLTKHKLSVNNYKVRHDCCVISWRTDEDERMNGWK